MTESVYRRVLGASLDLLSPELRPYFDGGQCVGVGSGVFDVAGSPLRILKPVLAFMAWQRILFPEYARNVPFDVINTPTADGDLGAVRTFHFPGRDRALQDEMRVVDGHLHDFLGRRGGFEVRLELAVTDGRMRLRSDRQWLRLAGLRLRIPALATVTVDESWADGRQHVDVRLHTPLLGDWFRYAGHFTYGYE
ncbi:DUF4166 domain-containing protein [Salinibacterium sp. NK8237]|uniref:DUF4166 domain-containing protein n=1 Tax=Salinibacterium sp. NK8237 TaxID=2792038 RepID=UPI0018CF35A0|nr:DUF4166 domain-containing protein [Salinibacterium sp. NK8237]MBH0130172.1 DUF4166 domain-containing protein [Salinibacterium sp. NK8237]